MLSFVQTICLYKGLLVKQMLYLQKKLVKDQPKISDKIFSEQNQNSFGLHD